MSIPAHNANEIMLNDNNSLLKNLIQYAQLGVMLIAVVTYGNTLQSKITVLEVKQEAMLVQVQLNLVRLKEDMLELKDSIRQINLTKGNTR